MFAFVAHRHAWVTFGTRSLRSIKSLFSCVAPVTRRETPSLFARGAKFKDFMREIEEEARAERPSAVAEPDASQRIFVSGVSLQAYFVSSERGLDDSLQESWPWR